MKEYEPHIIIDDPKPCESCAVLKAAKEEAEAALLTAKEFECRVTEAFRAIQKDVTYSQFVKLETAVYGSYSCSHAAEVERLKEDLETCIDERNGLYDYIQKLKEELRRRAGKEGKG